MLFCCFVLSIENKKNEKHKEAFHTSNDETSVHSVFACYKRLFASYVVVVGIIIIIITPKYAV
jgi:hypothetical protein